MYLRHANRLRPSTDFSRRRRQGAARLELFTIAKGCAGRRLIVLLCGGYLAWGAVAPSLQAQERAAAIEPPAKAAAGTEVGEVPQPKFVAARVAGGKVVFEVVEAWKKIEPRNRIIESEYQILPAEGDTQPGRLTVMASGGSIEQNKQRWYGQFVQEGGQSSEKLAKTEELKVDGQVVHLFDLSGTYKDQAGPFAPSTLRKDYRMLAAIVPTKEAGQYFIKLYGGKRTIAENEKAFRHLVESIRVQPSAK